MNRLPPLLISLVSVIFVMLYAAPSAAQRAPAVFVASGINLSIADLGDVDEGYTRPYRADYGFHIVTIGVEFKLGTKSRLSTSFGPYTSRLRESSVAESVYSSRAIGAQVVYSKFLSKRFSLAAGYRWAYLVELIARGGRGQRRTLDITELAANRSLHELLLSGDYLLSPRFTATLGVAYQLTPVLQTGALLDSGTVGGPFPLRRVILSTGIKYWLGIIPSRRLRGRR